ncbi:hypothetical protein DW974_15175 [Lachnospiraceae bacterium AM48-27BH]|nr:hypothetical protein DW974_15175 [Lachnospiraceae bacterium AM48-27BH]
MATSSITHDFTISGPENVKRFISALDEAEFDRSRQQHFSGQYLTDPQEILALLAKWETTSHA